jgi:hypothetical protein
MQGHPKSRKGGIASPLIMNIHQLSGPLGISDKVWRYCDPNTTDNLGIFNPPNKVINHLSDQGWQVNVQGWWKVI